MIKCHLGANLQKGQKRFHSQLYNNMPSLNLNNLSIEGEASSVTGHSNSSELVPERIDLSGIDLSGVNMTAVNLSNAILTNTKSRSFIELPNPLPNNTFKLKVNNLNQNILIGLKI